MIGRLARPCTNLCFMYRCHHWGEHGAAPSTSTRGRRRAPPPAPLGLERAASSAVGFRALSTHAPCSTPRRSLAPLPGPRPANSAPGAYSPAVARPATGSPLDLRRDRGLRPPALRAALAPSSQIRAPRPATAPPRSGSRLPATAIGPAPRTARMRR
jgi:hypothetical protein